MIDEEVDASKAKAKKLNPYEGKGNPTLTVVET